MNQNQIGEVLRAYRKRCNYKVCDVAIELKKRGHRSCESTIYGWECGRSIPDASCLIELCEIYHIENINHAFGLSEANEIIVVTSRESKVINGYRNIPDMRNAVDKLLDVTLD